MVANLQFGTDGFGLACLSLHSLLDNRQSMMLAGS